MDKLGWDCGAVEWVARGEARFAIGMVGEEEGEATPEVARAIASVRFAEVGDSAADIFEAPEAGVNFGNEAGGGREEGGRGGGAGFAPGERFAGELSTGGGEPEEVRARAGVGPGGEIGDNGGSQGWEDIDGQGSPSPFLSDRGDSLFSRKQIEEQEGHGIQSGFLKGFAAIPTALGRVFSPRPLKREARRDL